MDVKKVGKAIAYLRKRAGFTQKDLADRIGISDKAVSKWERGLGLPDIAYLGKLAILLDTDIDSLLAGDVIHHDKDWNGFLLLPENAYDIDASTRVYDKPLVYILLSYFLLVGIKTILVVGNEKELHYMRSEFGDGRKLGINLSYSGQKQEDVQTSLNKIKCNNLMVVYGRSFIYGVDQTRFFQKAMVHKDRLTILSLPKKPGVSSIGAVNSICFNDNMEIVPSESNEKVNTQYDYYAIPVLFCPRNVLDKIVCNSNKGDVKIDLTLCKDKKLYTEILDRGYVEVSIDTPETVNDVSNFVRLVQKACGMNIYCIEEIAWRRGMINLEQLEKFGREKVDTDYGKYILNLRYKY